MDKDIKNFIQSNSPDGGFLQSEEWRKFQESVGRKTFHLDFPYPDPLSKGEEDFSFWANVVEHSLPIVGKYFYIPRGPVCHPERSEGSRDSSLTLRMTDLINLAKKNKARWIRIEPATEEILKAWTRNVHYGHFVSIKKAPHDMQPREILFLDITKSEEELLAEMKAKTRYNIKLAQKHKVSIKLISDFGCHPGSSPGSRNIDSGSMAGMTNDYINKFIELVKITSKRDKIISHPENYYRKMFEAIPGDILKLYVAEYQGEIITANLIVFYGKTATYFHGASDNKHRNLMAPYLLQWQAIKDAKMAGYVRYDFGGIHTKTGEGITKFKTGFTPGALPVELPGSYDIIVSPYRYFIYKLLQTAKSFLR